MQFVNELAEKIWRVKYAGKCEDVDEYLRDLANHVAMGDEVLANKFFDVLTNGRFVPGGRILRWAGSVGGKVSLMNCTTHAVDADHIEAIAETVKTIMRASSRGQGIGIDLSNLRPMGSPVSNAAATSTGAVSFMEMLNHVGAAIGQNGRRGAMLFSLDISHPDIWRKGEKDVECPTCAGAGCDLCDDGFIPYDFLHVKRIPGRVESANISVRVSDAFMQAVDAGRTWKMEFDGRSGSGNFHVERVVPARELFMKLAESGFHAAEPGILFLDTARGMSNSDLLGEEFAVVGVNACSEVVLDQDGVCNLGSMNLGKYVEDPFTPRAVFNVARFVNDVDTAIRFLDSILDIELAGDLSVNERQRRSIMMLRRIGLGVMGFADALAMLGLPYDPDNVDTVLWSVGVFTAMRDTAYMTSVSLAKEKGMCGAFSNLSPLDRLEVVSRGFYSTLGANVREAIAEYGVRNATLLSVAPTGTISNFVGSSSGIEPVFALSYKRMTMISGKEEHVDYVHPGVELSRAAGVPDSVWQTAYQVAPHAHVKMQSLIQCFVDSAISKTTNLPGTATVDDVAQVYMEAWRRGLKGVTVYVDGSRHKQVLTAEQPQEACPSCGGELVREEGCVHCSSCEYGKCSL